MNSYLFMVCCSQHFQTVLSTNHKVNDFIKVTEENIVRQKRSPYQPIAEISAMKFKKTKANLRYNHNEIDQLWNSGPGPLALFQLGVLFFLSFHPKVPISSDCLVSFFLGSQKKKRILHQECDCEQHLVPTQEEMMNIGKVLMNFLPQWSEGILLVHTALRNLTLNVLKLQYQFVRQYW